MFAKSLVASICLIAPAMTIAQSSPSLPVARASPGT